MNMEVKSKIVNSWVQSIAIIIAGMWGLYQFIYVEKIKPAQEKPSLEIEVSIHNLGKITPKNDSKKLTAYRATITTKNIGKAKAFVASSFFQIHGDEVFRKNDDYQLKMENVYEIINKGNQQISKTYKTENSHLITTGTVYNPRSWFNVGQTISVDKIFYLSEENYSQIEANVFILSGADISDIYIRSKVDDNFDVDWEISDNKIEWHNMGSSAGQKIAAGKLSRTKANKYLPIIEASSSVVSGEQVVLATIPI